MKPAAATCLLLHYDQGFACAEIAEITGDSTDAVWQRLSLARRTFCKLYRKQEGANE
jgi:DNA-directed RNA polymerase specialized sigma24 family protein